MSPNNAPPPDVLLKADKAALIISFAVFGHGPAEPPDAAGKAQLLRGFECLVVELRKIATIPSGDVDQYVSLAQAGATPAQLMPLAAKFAELLPEVQYAAVLRRAGFSPATAVAPAHWQAEFIDAADLLSALIEAHGNDAEAMPEYQRALEQFVAFAPPEILESMAEQMAKGTERVQLPVHRLH